MVSSLEEPLSSQLSTPLLRPVTMPKSERNIKISILQNIDFTRNLFYQLTKELEIASNVSLTVAKEIKNGQKGM
jgi:hypothetical protein